MNKRVLPAIAVILSLALVGYSARTLGQTPDDNQQGEPDKTQDTPKKPVLGDRDDIVFQNQRYLKVKNDTMNTLTVFFQYRTLVNDAFTWLPAVPKEGAEAVSFEIKAGEEIQVKIGEEPMAASRVRLWATSETEKWLTCKTRDLWLVPEKNDEGDHVYAAEGLETFAFTFAAKKADTDDSDLPAGSTFPGQDPSMLLDVLPLPGDPLPDGGVMPVIRDLSVLPVYVSGVNAVIRVKNKGHLSVNLGRNLFVKRMVPGALPTNLGPIGALFHNGVKVFYVVGLAPGDYTAYVSPGDDPPYDVNDIRSFTIGTTAFTDLRVLPVFVFAGKATIKVKNVGSVDFAGGRKLRLVKLAPGAVPAEVGLIGGLAVNGVQTFAAIPLAPGSYKAYISPGDAMSYAANDSWTFAAGAAAFADLKVLPVGVLAGIVHVTVKNIGTAPAAAGKDLMVVKLAPGAVPVNKGPVGALAPGLGKAFAPFPLPPGSYKAYLSPGDPAPHAGNDFDNFVVGAAPFADLAVLNVSVIGGDVHVKVKNVGTAAGPAGRHLKIVKMVPGAMPMDKGDIGVLGPGVTKTFAPFALPAGNYKAFVSPGDPAPHAGNDSDTFAVAAAAVPDLAVGAPTKAGAKVKATITNMGPGKYTPGTRQWHLEKLTGMLWLPIPTAGGHAIPEMAAGASITVQGDFSGAGTYRIRITGADGNSANNSKSKGL